MIRNEDGELVAGLSVVGYRCYRVLGQPLSLLHFPAGSFGSSSAEWCARHHFAALSPCCPALIEGTMALGRTAGFCLSLDRPSSFSPKKWVEASLLVLKILLALKML